MERKPVLYVEDDDDDVFFMRRAFEAADVRNPLKVVQDGQEAIQYLSGAGPYANRAEHPLPTLVLLDLKLPRKGGLEILKWIREQPALNTLIVAVMTSSQNVLDIGQAYDLGANAYSVKPTGADKLVEMVRSLRQRFLD
ncbi:MAG: response regulator [Verrucomicrobia bacterium]|nr:response regulator [Verrucomicrobiota bacterium]